MFRISKCIVLNLTLIALASTFIFAQEPKIRWRSTDQLKWSDFKAPPVKNNPMAAETGTHLAFSMFSENGKIDWTLDCYFTPEKSWVKREHRSEDLLQHEQLHFDIAELNARRMRSQMTKVQVKSDKAMEKLQKIYEEGHKQMARDQQLYDKQTDHSEIRESQLKWIEKVHNELSEYSEFATQNYSFD